ncbi:DUF1338 domain-containing protein [Oceanisphaera marina]|uniref:2-oxoadipate dioxygenase/decarboxylase n=1 Tax=Oceanisphaera marina TaxID=2017550 RepID=A0ABQ1IFM7_9GAMM|nr:VOC family protein [Oceanisphaera marina]GGB37335.1 DUF1338 domain-containing protein [Oceanisphaera marina]
MALNVFMSPDDIRTLFSDAMSRMYQQEVPQYSTLMKLVAEVNHETLDADAQLAQQLAANNEQTRLSVERHGAIRVGSAAELNMLRRIFAIMGMAPVSYYDLSSAGVPVHSTAFRPVNETSLQQNPFRIFTSLLRLELIADDDLRAQAADILAKRDIFTSKARLLVSQAEAVGGLSAGQARQFVSEILETFRWHRHATVSLASYQALRQAHPLIADVVCFAGPHINHLTPRTLDIDAAQQKMPAMGIAPKAVIEGPPRRQCPILLRQTSFTALDEPVMFTDAQAGTHSARFGEIEQRGMALTPKGRALYDDLLNRARQAPAAENNTEHQHQLAEVFAQFPDDEHSLRVQQLGYFRYQLTDAGRQQVELHNPQLHNIVMSQDLEPLIQQGWVCATPITYEDFLPVSAAGIFQSNLGSSHYEAYGENANQTAFEQALGCAVLGEFSLYAKQQQDSITQLIDILSGEDTASDISS